MLVVLLLLPTAAADHSYSHRYVIFGRVVDAEGDPVPNATVQLSLTDGVRPEGSCSDQPGSSTDAFGPTRTRLTTDAWGEFVICIHLHTLARNGSEALQVVVPALNASAQAPIDAYVRQSFVLVQAADAEGAPANETTHTVVGRAWRASFEPVVVEGVTVFGDTLGLTPVLVRIPGHDPVATTTNHYGDFAVRVPITGPLPQGDVEVVVENETFATPLDLRGGITQALALFPAPRPASPTPAASPTATPPPTTAPSAAPTAFTTPTPEVVETPLGWSPAVLAAVAAALVLARRRHST